MSKLANLIPGSARGLLGRYLHARRYAVSLPLSVALLEEGRAGASLPAGPEMAGQLRDISRTGISLFIPSLRIGDRFLLTGHYPMRVMLELPNGVVRMKVAPVRYDRVREDHVDSQYMVGARIVQMAEPDRERLMQYIRQAGKRRTEVLGFARDAESI